jgi:hypothetical protein
MRILIIVACLAVLGGCAIQSSQLSAVMGFFSTPTKDLSLHSWSVKYAGYEAIVYAVNLPEGTLFSNQAGDQILFDGWAVRRVSGLGVGDLAYQNTDTDSQRSFLRGVRTIAVHSCDEWKQKDKSGKKKFSQLCKGDKVYTNSILVDEGGKIIVIQQIVDDRNEPLILTKLN